MDLFNTNPVIRILDQDGEVDYYGPVLAPGQSAEYLAALLETIEWQHDEALMFGKRIITKRKVAWYGDQNFGYTYSKTTKFALPWTAELLALKQLVERTSGLSYNSCLLNLYHNGEEGMGWHSDDERSLTRDSSIASVSLGAERKFELRHKVSAEKVAVFLENGSLLVMKGATQRNWLHAMPKAARILTARVNLTFRTMAL